jgi:hypothetical protein
MEASRAGPSRAKIAGVVIEGCRESAYRLRRTVKDSEIKM